MADFITEEGNICSEQQSEIWKPVKGYEGLYEVSNLGRVRSLDRTITKAGRYGMMDVVRKGKLLKPQLGKSGYLCIILCKLGKSKMIFVHRLVATSFIGDIDEEHEVNHIDYNRTNNKLENLEIVTHAENMHHSAINFCKPHKSKRNELRCIWLYNGKKGMKYIVGIRHKRIRTYIGRFSTLEEAIKARDKAYEEIGYYTEQ